MREILAWQFDDPGQPMVQRNHTVEPLAPDEVLIRVAGCGVCHTDLGFFYDGVRTIKPLPLTLGHEISGFVEESGDQAKSWLGRAVIVPAVLPCGDCEFCQKGRATICRSQKMPGNHIDGGFATHLVVPSRFLCPVAVDDANAAFGASGVTLRELAVIADAVTTPYQAIKSAGLQAGELAIFVGTGGIGGFGVQIAKSLGAAVVAIDLDNNRLRLLSEYGADLTLNPRELEPKEIRKSIHAFVHEQSLPPYEWKIFETSGSSAGQELAFSLLTFGATLSVVGFTMEKIKLRLSNLMAYDARAIGNWGCVPQFYPEVLEMVKSGAIRLAPFVQTFPLSTINSVFERVHRHEMAKRPVLVPDIE